MLDESYIIEQYQDKERSARDIAEELGTYANKIRRILIKHGLKCRTKSEAQVTALKSGRHVHPTQGKKRPQSVKDKISDKVSLNWKTMDEDERKRRSEISKQYWENMSPEDKADLMRAANEAVRLASKEGSRLEKHLCHNLTEAGYAVEYHKEGLIPNFKLEIDIFLPELSVAIEVDGPSHFLPIWGEDKLLKNIEADQEKAGLITSQGLVLIRLKYLTKNISNKTMRTAWTQVHKVIEDIRHNFPDKQHRYIEIEVN